MKENDPGSNLIPRLTPGILPNVRFDLAAGFLVFLITVPLSVAIAHASGFPPMAGIWSAAIGGVMGSLISNSELTIKGPTAGLIVVVLGAVTELGNEFGSGLSPADRAMIGYRLALGIGVTAGVIQIVFGLLRAGQLTEYFPLTPVRGVLAGVGLIVIAQQGYEVLGTTPDPEASPLQLFAGLPAAITNLSPHDAFIGGMVLLILLGLPLIRLSWIRRIPLYFVALILAIGLGIAFNFEQQHFSASQDGFVDSEQTRSFEAGPRYLVDLPDMLDDPASAFAFPDFRGIATLTGIRYIVLFCLIGSLESLLGRRAIELLDPWRRKTNFDRDLLAVGAANTFASAIGGLPMVSEIARSKINIDGGGRTRSANFLHAVFLLGFLLLCPKLFRSIPLAALGAILVFTGFRLAGPQEFIRIGRMGGERFVVFVGTILATVAAGMLTGIVVGIALEIAFLLRHGCPLTSLFRPDVEVVPEGDRLVVLVVGQAAVFSNWAGVRARILREAVGRHEVVLDLSRTRIVDHTVMDQLHRLKGEFSRCGKRLAEMGMEELIPFSSYPLSGRKSCARTTVSPRCAHTSPGARARGHGDRM